MKNRYLFHNAGTTVALMIVATMVSKVLGMLRQIMTASIFAASMEGIAFSAASGIPLAIFDMLFSTAVLGSFVPIYKGQLDLDGMRARSFSSSFLTVVFLLTALVSALGMVLARPIMRLTAPDLDERTLALAVVLLRIMFPSMIFAGAAYTLVGILQSHEKFLLPAFVSAVSNLLLILYLLFCREPQHASVIGLAVTYLVSWLAQFLTLAIPLWKNRAFPVPTVHLKNPDTALAVKRALPVMLGSWLIPMLTLLAKGFSSFVNTGAVTGAAIVVYENAFSVFSIAAGFLTYGVCNYLFPKLSAQFAAGNEEAFAESVRKGLFAAIALILPTSGALFLLSEEVVELLYLRDNFTAELSAATAVSLKIMTLSLPAFGMTEFFSRVYYSCTQARYPALASLTGITVTFLSCIAFHAAEQITVETVALSVVLGQTAAGFFLLCIGLKIFENKRRRERKQYLLLFSGYLLCMLAMWACRNILRSFFHFSEDFCNFLVTAIVFAVGFVIYSIWMVLTKIVRIPNPFGVAEENNI